MADGTQVGSIYYDLDLDDKDFKGKASSVKNELRGLEDSFSRAEMGSKLFAGALAAVGAAGISAIGFGIKVAGDLEAARQGFVALLGSAEKADATMARIKKEAASTPFEMTGLVEGAQALTAITKDGNKAIDTLLDVGKAIATSGKGQAELDRVIMNLQQIASTGKVTAMDIRQFQYAIPLFNDILKSAGLTTQQLLDSEDAATLLFQAFKKAGQEGGVTAKGFESQAGTFKQLWSNFIDTVTIAASDFVKQTGIFDAVKKALDGLIKVIQAFTTPKAIKEFTKMVTEWWPVIVGIIVGGLTPAFIGMIPAIMAIVGSLLALLPYIAVGAAIGLGIKWLIDLMGGWDNVSKRFADAFTYIQGKLQPFVDFFSQKIERVKQILQNFGISGEFGGAITAFQTLFDKGSFYTERLMQIAGDNLQTLKNKLAGFGEGQNASWIDAINGALDRMQPLIDAIKQTLEPMMAQLALAGQIIQTQVKPAWDALMETLRPFIEALAPVVVDFLKQLVIGFALLVAGIILLVTTILVGLVGAFANALPYIMQALEGLIQFIRGVVQIITGLLTGDMGLVIEGFKQMFKGAYDFITNILTAIQKFISGFVKTVISFFVNLYNELVGHSIIPDLVNKIFEWFNKIPNLVKSALSTLADVIMAPFKKAWEWIEPILNKMKEGLDKINPFHRESPSLVDNVRAGVDEIMQQYGRLQQLQVPALAGAGTQVGGNSTNQDISIYIDKVGDQQDVSAIGRELGFRAGIMPR